MTTVEILTTTRDPYKLADQAELDVGYLVRKSIYHSIKRTIQRSEISLPVMENILTVLDPEYPLV